jgi:rubrerythrin
MKYIYLLATVILILSALVNAWNDTCPDDLPFSVKQDLTVLNYALTLEHLEYAFYRDGLELFNETVATTATDGNFTSTDYHYLTLIRDHEQEHVNTLTSVIEQLGGTPVEECSYDFGYGNDFEQFLQIAAALENTGVSAYLGALALINSKDLLTAAGTIATVEARHASWLNYKTGQVPFPDSFDTPLNQSQVLGIASQFISSCPDFNSQCFGDSNADTVCSGHGTCSGPDLCLCEPGWAGPNCSCEAQCQLCESPNQCCDDVSKGFLCYSPETHHCVENNEGNNVLCGNGDGACGTVCYDEQYYTCDDNGSLVPIGATFHRMDNKEQFEVEDIQIQVPPNRVDANTGSFLTVSTVSMIMCIVLALL